MSPKLAIITQERSC